MSEEQVLVIPAKVMHEAIGDRTGIVPYSLPDFCWLTSPASVTFLPRSRAEHDPSFKQLIPYCIIQTEDQHGVPHYLQYTRGNSQGEKRLHAKKSVGVGGHINSGDNQASADPYMEGMNRELREELLIVGDYRQEPVGFIYDDSDDVGRVHLGIVHLVHLSGYATPAESGMVDAGFSTLDDLLAQREDFETWSQLCIDGLVAARK